MFKPSTPKSLCALLLALVMAASSVATFAQSQAGSGQIVGTITDSAGAAISTATIKVKNTKTGLERTATTSEDGNFTIVLLPPGTYSVTIEASGFQTGTAQVEVTVGRTAELKLSLGTSGVSESVNVSAGAVQVQTTRSEADAVITERAIENLPINGRRFQDFVTLTPSAQVDPQRGQISLSGQRGIYGANVNVDGADYNQPFFGGIRGGERSNTAFTIPQESIKEFQVIASGYSAEFGRSTGGIVNAVTKSGTNDWHGSLFYLVRPEDLARKNEYFDDLEEFLNPAASLATRPFRNVVPAPTQQQYGGSFGGRIKRDKAFFFISYEHQEFENNRQVVFDNLAGFTPTAATQEAFDFFKSLEEPFVQTNDADAVLGRFDYEINNSHRFNIRYSYSRNEALNANAVGNQLFPTTQSALSNNGTEKDETNTVVGQFASIFGPTIVNEFRGQYSREERPRLSNSELPTTQSVIGNFGAVRFLPTTQYDWRLQFADSVTWTKGNHSFKFGGEYNHVFVNQFFGFNQFGFYNINGTVVSTVLDIFGTGGATANRFDTTAVTYQRQIGNRFAEYSTDELAFFAQDSWRIRPNFTLNYGLRWEGQYNPDPESNNEFLVNAVRNVRFPSGHILDPTQIPDSTDQFGPRLGFAWDPRSDGKTVIRAHSGIYFSRTPLLVLAAPFNNFRDPAGDLSVQLPFPVPASNPNNTLYEQLLLIGINLNNVTLGNLPNITPEQIQQIASRLGLSPNPFLGSAPIGIAEDFKNPKSYQYGIGIEHELARGLTVRADYSHVQTVYLQRNRDINLPLPRIRQDDIAQRPFFGLRSGTPRPVPVLNSVQVRESTAKGLYRGLTLGMKFQRSRLQFNAFYTLSKNLSDDDNERDAGGVAFENAFDLTREYHYSRIDRKHMFVANPVVTLPWAIEASSAIRLRSGRPVDATFGSDANEDIGGPDRPFNAPGNPFIRNGFRNRALYDVDVRIQKRINLGGDVRRLLLSAEFFNIFNLTNIELAGAQVTNFCQAPIGRDCGFSVPTNVNFLSLRDQAPNSTRFGKLLLNNNPGSPFQMQLGARFLF